VGTKDKGQMFAAGKLTGTIVHRHIVISGLDSVLNGRSSWCHNCQAGSTATDEDGKFVVGPISWITENPGSQLLTGSFHPVSDDAWDNDAYGGSHHSYSIRSTTTATTPILPTIQTILPTQPSAFGTTNNSLGFGSNTTTPTPTTTPLATLFSGNSSFKFPTTIAPSNSFSFGSPATPSFGEAPTPNTFSFGSKTAATTTFGASGFGAPTTTTFGTTTFGTPDTPVEIKESKVKSKKKSETQPPRSPIQASETFGSSSLSAALTNQFDAHSPAKFGGPTSTPGFESISPSKFGGGTSTITTSPTLAQFDINRGNVVFDSADVRSFGGGTVGLGSQQDISSFGGGRTLPPPSSPNKSPTKLHSTPKRSDTSSTNESLTQIFNNTEPPKSPVAKLLLLVSMLYKGGKINDNEKNRIKDLVINGDKAVICALEVFEVEKDFDELADTFRRLSSLVEKY